jgi:hypothetical protein
MPIYRYNDGGEWQVMGNIYRYNDNGEWLPMNAVYRYNDGGEWQVIYLRNSNLPAVSTAPTLVDQFGSDFYFTQNSTITLNRGTWTNTGSTFTPVYYNLTIQYKTDSDNTWTNVTPTSTTPTNPVGTTGYNNYQTVSYALTLQDVRNPSYSYRGRVNVKNDVGESLTYFTTPVRSSMEISVTDPVVTVNSVSNSLGVSWTTTPTNNSSNISSQTLEIITNEAYTYNGQTFDLYDTVYTTTINPGTGTATINIDGTNIKPSTSFYAAITVVANDTDETVAFASSLDFTTPAAAPAAFTYNISNAGTVTTPGPITATRSNDNKLYFNWASLTPSDTYNYLFAWSGSGIGSTGSRAVDFLNIYNSFSSGADEVLDISSAANNSPVNVSVTANGIRRTINADVTTTQGAQSWAINFSWYGAGANTVTTFSNGTGTLRSGGGTVAVPVTVTVFTNSFPVKIAEITGDSNPTIYINSIVAYSSTSQSGTQRSGTPGSVVLSSLSRPTSTATFSNNYTYDSPPGNPSSVVMKTFSPYQATIFFTTGSNTQSVQGEAWYDSTSAFDNIYGLTNVGSNTAGKVLVTGANSLSRTYNSRVRAYSGQNGGGVVGSSVSGDSKTLNGADAMSVSNFFLVNNTSSSLTITWNGAGAVNKYRARLYRTSNNSLVEDKGYTLTSGEATFNGLISSTEYYVVVNPRYEYTSSVFEDGTQGTSTNFQTRANLTPPTPTGVSFNNGTFTVTFTGGSGPWYQGWYVAGDSTRPTVSVYDSGTPTQSSPMTWSFTPSSGTTYYFWVRSSIAQTSNTFNDVSEWSLTSVSFTPSSPAFVSFSITPSSAAAGSVFTANSTFSGNPAPSASYQWQYFEGGAFGWVALSNGTSQTYTSPSNYNTIYGSNLRCVITGSNGISPNVQAIPTATVTAPVLAPTNSSIPTLSPTSISVGTQLSAGIGSWNNNPTSYDIRIYRGTAGVVTSETLVASRSSSSTANLTYTVTQADYDSGQRYFRTYVNASNAGGSSGLIPGQERGPIAAPVSIPSGGSVTLSGNNTAGSVITASTSPSGWSGSPTSYDVYITTALSPNTPTSSSTRVAQSNGGSSTSYTITSSDAISPVNVFRAFATASNSAGTSGTVQSSNTITTQSAPSGTAPATPTNGGGTFATGTNYVTNATFTSSASGTTPITYSWTVYSSTSSAGPWSFRNSGSLSSSSLSTSLSIPQQSWNQASFGSWAQYNVAASNSIGSSPGTLTWLL